MNRRSWVIVLIGIAIFAAACGTRVGGGARTVETPDDVKRIGPAEAKSMVDSGGALLYDSRAMESYVEAHAAGAISLPEEEVRTRFDSLPTNRAVIFYCT